MGHTPQSAVPSTSGTPIRGLQCPEHSARVRSGPPRGGTSPNSPRAGRQQGQASSSRYAGGPLMRVGRVVRGADQIHSALRVGRVVREAD